MEHPKNIVRAKELRRNMPEAERILWSRIQKNKLGFQFRRQHPIGKYYADFVCIEKRLVIELDGHQHGNDDAMKYDNERTDFIKSQGWQVIRIPNGHIKNKLNEILYSLQLVLNGMDDAKDLFWEKYD
ncbi:MAG: DUF559 domain-containing protein [Alphaproteobacteria bacterium]|nr:DUF559 domain-containing protein [Alphaproteobacteria bacterium]